jgi:hypothetical protein
MPPSLRNTAPTFRLPPPFFRHALTPLHNVAFIEQPIDFLEREIRRLGIAKVLRFDSSVYKRYITPPGKSGEVTTKTDHA